ncbi:VOC family protein [Nocardioides sp. TF02-7]|uniref:VOC family protein n=1 Tax=Nocardioides sp. TF02-7 TaxID=2917724 RepID=UPI001F070C30|nr:VOC family protein [Nocardioides sp. TF02-7]UMG91481.1 hypothetical protein MF408_15290 [Nocardioides sp. TF02-7]
MSNPGETGDLTEAVRPTWATAFLDFAPEGFEAGVDFWSALTAYDVSPPRGDDGEFATLLPPAGDDCLRVQRLREGPDDVHVDLHVADPRAAAERARRLGATEVEDRGYVVMRSPGGLGLCFVHAGESTRPRPTEWPEGHTSLLDQVCIDAPAPAYDAECAFWAAVTGWGARRAPRRAGVPAPGAAAGAAGPLPPAAAGGGLRTGPRPPRLGDARPGRRGPAARRGRRRAGRRARAVDGARRPQRPGLLRHRPRSRGRRLGLTVWLASATWTTPTAGTHRCEPTR